MRDLAPAIPRLDVPTFAHRRQNTDSNAHLFGIAEVLRSSFCAQLIVVAARCCFNGKRQKKRTC